MKKCFNVGFTEIQVVERSPFGLADLARYPLFAPDFLDFMRRRHAPERHEELVFSIALTATSPEVPLGA
jgi:hypothetical protein